MLANRCNLQTHKLERYNIKKTELNCFEHAAYKRYTIILSLRSFSCFKDLLRALTLKINNTLAKFKTNYRCETLNIETILNSVQPNKLYPYCYWRNYYCHPLFGIEEFQLLRCFHSFRLIFNFVSHVCLF